MRITTGILRGQKIEFPKSDATRPMMDYIKQSLINSLHSRIDFSDQKVLDLFSGSGQLGLEAISRGAYFCYFNEIHPETYAILQHNLRSVDPKKYFVFRNDYLYVLNKLAAGKVKFNLIFLDPPFAKIIFYHKAIEVILSNGLLDDYGLIAVEASRDFDWSEHGLVAVFSREKKNKF